MNVQLNRNSPYYLQIEFSDIDGESDNHIICEDLVMKISQNPYQKVKIAFPGMFKDLKSKCKSVEQLQEVESWFNQEVDAILRPLSYYV